MDGCIENGKKVYRVLLWIEPDCAHYIHQFESERIAEEMKDFIEGLK